MSEVEDDDLSSIENIEINKLVMEISASLSSISEEAEKLPFIRVKALIRLLQIILEGRVIPDDKNKQQELINATSKNLLIKVIYVPDEEK